MGTKVGKGGGAPDGGAGMVVTSSAAAVASTKSSRTQGRFTRQKQSGNDQTSVALRVALKSSKPVVLRRWVGMLLILSGGSSGIASWHPRETLKHGQFFDPYSF
jgi:hypothetical protein